MKKSSLLSSTEKCVIFHTNGQIIEEEEREKEKKEGRKGMGGEGRGGERRKFDVIKPLIVNLVYSLYSCNYLIPGY